MKSFKLVSLEVMGNEEDNIAHRKIHLHDGLVINREDEHGWLIEAFMDNEHLDFFRHHHQAEEVMLKAKITRTDNDPAFFITEIVSVNEITNEKINVLFQGDVIDHRKSKIEEMLKMIIEEGYQGESLLRKFKELMK